MRTKYKMNICWVYILECSDGTYHTGSTKNLKWRLIEHQKGEGANYTRKRRPLKLVYYEEFDRIDDAYSRERQIHGWRREKKEKLIAGSEVDLKGMGTRKPFDSEG